MSRGSLAALLVVFTLTRLAGGWVADHPQQVYEARGFGTVSGDVFIYQQWANFLLNDDVAAYSGVGIEYPPGSLPFMAVPELVRGDVPYQRAFVSLMVLLDVAGLVGLLLAARRWGSSLGPWLWVVLVPLLGPIVYARLDMAPAVMGIWAMTSASAGAWLAVGAWLGFGALTKIWPGFLLPGALLVSPHRRQTLVGAVMLVLAPLLPFLLHADDVVRSVVGYHLERGIQIESLWASLLLLGSRFGRPAPVVYNFGAYHMDGPLAAELKLLSSALSVVALAAGIFLAWKAVPRGDGARLASALFATLALVQAVGSVFSPQFVIWLIALGAAAACARSCPIRGPILLLAPVALLTQLIFPFFYPGLAPAFTSSLAILLARNALVLVLALWAFVGVWRSRPRERAAVRAEPEAASVTA